MILRFPKSSGNFSYTHEDLWPHILVLVLTISFTPSGDGLFVSSCMNQNGPCRKTMPWSSVMAKCHPVPWNKSPSHESSSGWEGRVNKVTVTVTLTFFLSISSVFVFQVIDYYFLEIIFCHTKSNFLWMLVFLYVGLWSVQFVIGKRSPSSPRAGIFSAPRRAPGSPCTGEWPSGYQVGAIWLDAYFLPMSGYFLLKTQYSSQKTSTLRKSFLETFPYLFITPRIKLPSEFHTKHAFKTLTHHF